VFNVFIVKKRRERKREERREEEYSFIEFDLWKSPFDTSSILNANLFDSRRWKACELNILKVEFVDSL
jgi:hypothetical protein